jgi:hypothetical protein
MSMVIPNEGKLLWLDRALRTPTNAPEDYVCQLFQSNTTVVDASTLTDFTIATFPGYADVSVPRSAFGAPTISSNIAQTVVGASPSFDCTGGAGQTVYGWLLVGAVSGKIIAGQNFAAPRVMVTGANETLAPFTFKFQTFH